MEFVYIKYIISMCYVDGRFIFGGDRIPHPLHRPGLLHPIPKFHDDSKSIRVNREHAAEVLPILKDLKVKTLKFVFNVYQRNILVKFEFLYRYTLYCLLTDRKDLGWNYAV